jgi:hypothetical protein
MIQRHYCLASPDEGRSALGDQLDCPECRIALLESFRSAPEAPEIEQAKQRHPSGRLPHLSVPADSARIIDLYREPDGLAADPNLCPFCGKRRADMQAHVEGCHPAEFEAFVAGSPPIHITEHGVDPDPDQPGGDWFVRCTCGWTRIGSYARDAGRGTAARLARIKAERHRAHPEEDEDQ